MNKFFIAGSKCLILGQEIKNNYINFSIGQTIFNQEPFVSVKKIKKSVFVERKFFKKNKNYKEGINLVFVAVNKYFPKSKIIFAENIDISPTHDSNTSKYKKITDVYENPIDVPWNFVPTEIEEILSKFSSRLLKNKKILYIGAGYGKNIWAISAKKYDIEAIEFSGIAVKRANKFLGSNVVIQGDLLNFKAVSKRYDVVIDIGCLHCIDKSKQRKAVDKIYESMKVGGILVSRIFKPKDAVWLKKMPFKAKEFGLAKNDIFCLFDDKFIVKIKYENKYYFIIELKKC